jgi:hypothetical protein
MEDKHLTEMLVFGLGRRASRLVALYSIILLPLRVEMQICIPQPSEVAPSTLR